MDAKQLMLDGQPYPAWVCSSCNHSWDSKPSADECCTCRTCGKPKAGVNHDECRKQQEQESAQNTRAWFIDPKNQLDAATYDGPVWQDDKAFPTLLDWLWYIEDYPEEEWPEFVMTAEPTYFWRDMPEQAMEALGGLIGDAMWEDFDYHDLKGTKELQQALEDYAKANTDLETYEEGCRALVVKDLIVRAKQLRDAWEATRAKWIEEKCAICDDHREAGCNHDSNMPKQVPCSAFHTSRW